MLPMVGDREQRLEGFLDLKAGCTDEFVFLKKKIASLHASFEGERVIALESW